MRNHRIAIVVEPEPLIKLDELSEKKSVKRAALVSDLVEGYTKLGDRFINQDLEIISEEEIIQKFLDGKELMIDDNYSVVNLAYDIKTGMIKGNSEWIVHPESTKKSWFQKIFSIFD